MLNEEECKQLAPTICDKGFVNAGSWDMVNGGCFVYSTWQKSECGVYFNRESFTGKFDADHISVCRLKSRNNKYFLFMYELYYFRPDFFLLEKFIEKVIFMEFGGI